MDRGLGLRAPSRSRGIRALLTAMGVLSLAAPAAWAERYWSTNGYFTVRVETANGTGTAIVPFDMYSVDPATGGPLWQYDGALDVKDARGNTLATLTDLSVPEQVRMEYNSRDNRTPVVVGLAFNVVALTDASITIGSDIVEVFPPIPADVAQGRASASLTVTDLDGDGATLSAGIDDEFSYAAQVNPTDGDATSGTNFASLLTSVSATPFDSNTINEDFADGGLFADVNTEVSAISSYYQFALTAGDSASGTSVFVVVPEPATLALLIGGLGSLFMRRRS